MDINSLDRFVEAQEKMYPIAMKEIQAGKKESHWMWYIFPQIKGLGRSETSLFYAIKVYFFNSCGHIKKFHRQPTL